MGVKEKKKSEKEYHCTRCGEPVAENHLYIKTKRDTVTRLCDKCKAKGL